MIIIKNCVVCNKELSDTGFVVKDKLVSGKEFFLQKCYDCAILHTSPVPEASELNNYYKSNDYISHSEKPKGLFDKLYFFIRRRMINKKIKFVKKYAKRKENILDFGCGTGFFLEKCQVEGMNSFGFEPDINAAEIAKQKIKTKVFNELEQLEQFKTGPFDIITLWHALEHIYELDNTMKTINDILREDGLLAIAVPDYESHDAAFYKNNWAAYDAPRHLYHFNKNAIKKLGEKYNLRLIGKKPLIFDSFFVSLLSEKNSKSFFSVARAAFVGLVSNIFGLLKIKPYSSQVYFLIKNGQLDKPL